MANFIDYLQWRGDLELSVHPFNEVDALILARLAYAPFGKIGLSSSEEFLTVKETADRLLALPDVDEQIHAKADLELLQALSQSKRFGDMRLGHYVNRIDEKKQMQFSAVTVQVSDELCFVAYRGTDDTLVGWKENFNMTYMSPVPAQETAVDYLKFISEDASGQFILGGHSKGGNLAVYAAAFCTDELKQRILSVYSFDGPGFGESVVADPRYDEICARTKTFIPQSSIVGLLLEHEEQYIVVKSLQKTGFLQHDVYSWLVEKDHLSYQEEVTGGSKVIDHTLKGWVADMEPRQREKFFDALYAIIAETNAHTFRELGDNWLKSTKIILSSVSNLDEPSRKIITKALALFIKNLKKSLTQPDGDEESKA